MRIKVQMKIYKNKNKYFYENKSENKTFKEKVKIEVKVEMKIHIKSFKVDSSLALFSV